MTKKQLIERVAELEKRVQELERRSFSPFPWPQGWQPSWIPATDNLPNPYPWPLIRSGTACTTTLSDLTGGEITTSLVTATPKI